MKASGLRSACPTTSSPPPGRRWPTESRSACCGPARRRPSPSRRAPRDEHGIPPGPQLTTGDGMTSQLPRPRSGPLTTGPARAPARAMLRAVGLSEEDLERPQVAVASSWNEVTPCTLHLNGLAVAAKEGVRQGGAVPFEFGTIAVSDGISMGHEGMKASLVSREIIADSVELMGHAERFDALVTIAGC